jgi:hypothetical protein
MGESGERASQSATGSSFHSGHGRRCACAKRFLIS